MADATLLVGGDDTIVARATAEGRSALATIRLSGARALAIASALGASVGASRRVTRVRLRHPHSGAPLDDALMTVFRAPHSYTGEDVVEWSTHGGQVVPTLIVAACIAAGARTALPGEFTRRAVLNGKLDVLQAEAIGDLIDARSTAMQQHALGQLDGGLSRRLLALRDEIIQLEAMLAYDIDFPEEDDGPIDPAAISSAARELVRSLAALLATAPQGALLRHGALVVIAGPPNAGKSSLFNALLGEARALVTPVAGTTRDAIDAVLDRSPVPLRLVDTAGLRDTDDTLEQLGIEVSLRYLAGARVVLACGETAADVERVADVISTRTTATIVRVQTKADLLPTGDTPTSSKDRDTHGSETPCLVSAETGSGLAALLSRIDAVVATDDASTPEAVVITRERHQRGLRDAELEVTRFLEGWESGALPATVAAVHLQAARDALSELVGVIGTEDILDRVFSSFCIGK